ncbi:M13 family metallopeptidase [Dyella mobilis]|uniref:M13 family metallopeptidase n=1 Tax=Dyella mobilis TaxID=1849582 RepID=A0ABS2KN36_9GAMM|nr:M13 family metallopeptidase [Dyella mobilis]MBM7131858.1 M13 family metallopeptidase [Dyella mobilis]GLQ96160.1 metallopeptidase [Dyella mobilis]
MFSIRKAVLAALCLYPLGALAADPTPNFNSPDGQYLDWLDHSVKPGTDFFHFANGSWLKANPIPADRSEWGAYVALDLQNQRYIHDMVEKASQDTAAAAGSAEKKVGDFYASGMDEKTIDSAGIKPLQPELDRIAAISSVAQLQDEFAHLTMIGVAAPFALAQMQDFKDSSKVIAVVMQAGLGLPDRDFYVEGGANNEHIRKEYVPHVARTFQLLGDSASVADAEAKTVMALEISLAKASMTDVAMRDPHAVYHLMDVASANALTPKLHWQAVMTGVGHPEIQNFNVATPDFFKAVNDKLTSVSLDDWKTYLRWQLVQTYEPYLSKPFADEGFRMSSVLSGEQQQKPRWQRVLRAEDGALGFAIGKVYVDQKFPPAYKQAATQMVNQIRDALRQDLKTLSWMTPATREAAVKKLDMMELRVGYPDKWRDYSTLQIDRGPYVLNVMRATTFEQQRELAKIGKPVDRSDWDMTPQTVNAYYDPSMNSLNIPAGILQPPSYDPSWPDAVNYGNTGATIGHEMTHGFDDQGAQFDGHGNLKNWWSPADLKKFQVAVKCVADQYSQYTVDGGVHVQGKLVTGEAIADQGGLILALRAFHAQPGYASAKTIDGFTPDQQFFIAYAHSWAMATRPETAKTRVTTDPHPPEIYRTNGVLADIPEFQKAFGIVPPSPMVKKDRCVIW